MDISKLSTVLRQDKHGIWVSSHAAVISYPSDGNSRCFQVEDRSYWFEHRNNVISDAVGKYSKTTGTEKLDIIDIGGGNGFVSARLAADGHNVVLLEPGPEGALNAKIKRNRQFLPIFSGSVYRFRLRSTEGTNMELGKDRRVFVRLGFTDMRKQINGLAAIAQESRPEGPFDGSYFVFCGKTKRVLKILYWDATGFCLWQKRLETELFPWPREGHELDEMTRQNIRLVLKGIDVWKEHKAVQYRIAG